MFLDLNRDFIRVIEIVPFTMATNFLSSLIWYILSVHVYGPKEYLIFVSLTSDSVAENNLKGCESKLLTTSKLQQPNSDLNYNCIKASKKEIKQLSLLVQDI
jgi:hypothetical protein